MASLTHSSPVPPRYDNAARTMRLYHHVVLLRCWASHGTYMGWVHTQNRGIAEDRASDFLRQPGQQSLLACV